MKKDTVLQSICRNILEIHNEAPSDAELDAFLKAGGSGYLLSAFSDELMQNWHTWNKGRQEGGQEKQATDDAAPEDNIISVAGQENIEDILAAFEKTEDKDAPSQDNLNEEEDVVVAELPAEENSTEPIKPDDIPTAPATTEAPLLPTDQSCTLTAPPSQAEPTECPPECPPAPKDAEAQPPTADSDVHLPPQSPTMNRDYSSSTVLFKLPNAMVNTSYSEPLAVEGGEVIKITKVEGLEDSGIRYDEEIQSVRGNPVKPGEFNLTITYTLQSGGSSQGQLNFVVNHDPKSLWKDIPSDEAVKFWKKDEDSQEQDGRDGWKLVGASKRGRSHAHEGKCRDDDFVLIGEHPEKWHILAVADGAGSSQYSREGSRIAVNTSADFLAAKLTEHNYALIKAVSAWDKEKTDRTDADLRQVLYAVFSQVIYKAINTIHLTSQKEQCKFRNFYATLLIAVHKQIQGRHFVAGYWIGDGGMAVYKEGEDGYVKLLGEPDSGEYAGQTRFLDPEANDGEDIMRRISFDYLDSMTALFLLTDGITDPIFETDHNLQQPACWDKFWAEEIRQKLSGTPGETEKNLLDWLSFWSPSNHDDRTIALLASAL